MGSRQAQLPDTPACSDRLEAKLDRLAQKLNAHLARAEATTGGCPACLTCCKHAEKHQETDRKVETQAHLLDILDKRTLEILGLLQRMVKEVEPSKQPIGVEPNNASQVIVMPLKIASAGAHPKTSGGGKTLAPPLQIATTVKLAVPMATAATPALRHVSSCPELQVSALKSAVQTMEPGPRSKGESKPAGPGPDSGIQIRVFPAAQDMASHGSAVQTCQKVIDDMTPRPALFPHRCVSPSSAPISDDFLIHTWEVLGSGRFGKVYRCKERHSGLMLAAKVINTRTAKEKEMALNEVQVMNQLSHGNVLQLYQAMETRNQVVLILE
ncbi:hypothetical protein NHX12_012941 [Muraenolepis orangiensis]|uniref:Protein kinase domain-containing protein n=1 Tax=Muraenolepis orangiensis TaxID=630683 RepID=A0A9Q0DDQ7_9TELE|nr:hypothetical protein NHX12_012941 [Muraenolepis orangiensis]